MSDIRQRATDLIRAHMGLDETVLRDDYQLIENLGCDDLDLVEICMTFETEFGIEISDEHWAQAAELNGTLGAVLDLVVQLAGDGTAPAVRQSVSIPINADRMQRLLAGPSGPAIRAAAAAVAPADAPSGLQMRYFVLAPLSSDQAHATASLIGVRAYADAIAPYNAKLSADLLSWVSSILAKGSNSG